MAEGATRDNPIWLRHNEDTLISSAQGRPSAHVHDYDATRYKNLNKPFFEKFKDGVSIFQEEDIFLFKILKWGAYGAAFTAFPAMVHQNFKNTRGLALRKMEFYMESHTFTKVK